MNRRTFPKDAGERCALQCRTTETVRDRIASAAERSGRSVSQEIEFRLERSFECEDVATAVREEFARIGIEAERCAENETRLPNMRAEDLEEWMRH